MPFALDQRNSGILKLLIRNAAFFQLWGERKSRSAMVVKINKVLSETGRNFTYTLDTLALSRDLAMACEMLIKTSSWQTDLA